MCGIVGIVSVQGRPILPEELGSMCTAIAHRGPDDDGFYLRNEVGLGMRRLSIIDLSTGRQPISNEDGTIWIVFNGEIYNYRELRQELETRGHHFSTTTDTEVIVHLYEEHGSDCVQQMRGMFAFAVWDDRNKLLLLARDRLGIKPLYYAEIGGRVLFASELKAILQLPDVARCLDWSALGHVFTFLSTPPGNSIIQGVRKLPPGHTLTVGRDEPLCTRRYWDVQFQPDRSRSEEYFREGLETLLEESVLLHLASDVPVGAFLSGGVDSASVVALMSRASPARPMTFSIGFSDADYSELTSARLVAEQFGTEHYELILEPDALDIVEDVVWHLDEPFGDSSAIPTYMVSKLASQHVKVVLSGDGGDELFAGYDKYVVEHRERRYGLLPAAVRKCLAVAAAQMPYGIRGRNFLRHLSLRDTERYLDSITLFASDERRLLFAPDVFQMISASDPWAERRSFLDREIRLKKGSRDRLSALQNCDLHYYLPLDILTKVDRMSMAHSLEVRPPLLDHKLLEFVSTIPPEMLLRNGSTKHIFKQTMAKSLPAQILSRPKQGFAIPLGRWFRGRLEGYVHDLLLSARARQRGIISPTYIERLLEQHRRGRELDLQLWTLISFELWCRAFLDRNSQSRPVPLNRDSLLISRR